MIKAPELTYKAIYNALKAGHFYASTAPEIKELYIEDGFLCIKTSPAVRITMTTAGRQAKVACPESPNQTITEARFNLSELYASHMYVRITVTDEKGRSAWTQPVWGEFSEKR